MDCPHQSRGCSYRPLVKVVVAIDLVSSQGLGRLALGRLGFRASRLGVFAGEGVGVKACPSPEIVRGYRGILHKTMVVTECNLM